MIVLCWLYKFSIKFSIVGCAKFGADYYVFSCTHSWEPMKLSGKSWQLVTIIHKEGDGYIFCGSHSQGYDHICYCHVWFDFAIIDITCTLNA
jgi:hypothetical protein